MADAEEAQLELETGVIVERKMVFFFFFLALLYIY